MSIDISKIISNLGDDLAVKAGAPLGLNEEQSVLAAKALMNHMGGGKDLAIKAAAAELGLAEDVVSNMLSKMIDAGKEKLLADSGVQDALQGAQDQAMAAINNIGGEAAKGLFGKIGGLFGKK